MIEGAPESVEPGSPRMALLVGWLVVALILAVATMQQIGVSRERPAATEAVVPPPDVQFEASCRATVKMTHLGKQFPELAKLLVSEDDLKSLGKGRQRPEDRLRLAVVEAELTGVDKGLAALDALEPDLAGPLAEDAGTIRAALGGTALTPEEAARVEEHHGWFGRLAQVVARDDSDPQRQGVVGGGLAMLVVPVVFFAIAGVAVVAGFVLFIVAIVKIASGTIRTRFVPIAPGGSAMIETVAVFIISFLVLSLVIGLIADWRPQVGTPIKLGAQWLLLLVALWPVLRGMPRAAAMHSLGLHRGQGVLREIGAGIVGYLASLPLLLGAILVTIVVLAIRAAIRMRTGQPEDGPPNVAIGEVIAGADTPLRVLAIFLLATVWAPLMEELVFRGALFGHLRKRRGVVLSALLVAPAFALMHGLPVMLMGGVMTLGFAFSLLREWRGSLIAPMVAHCLNNAFIVSFVMLTLRLTS